MILKIKNDELDTLIRALQSIEKVTFNTKLEAKLCGKILREFLTSIQKKAIDSKPKPKLNLDEKTCLVLNCILPQLWMEHPWDKATLIILIEKINKECLNIS